MANKIETLHSYLVHPGKHADPQPAISGTSVPNQGRLFEMMSEVFGRADDECHLEISFNSDDSGNQQNACRGDLLSYLKSRKEGDGKRLAERLQRVTNQQSGLGLLFLIVGRVGATTKVVISRFPADHGILAEENANKLTVAYLEKVFMKSARAYKSAVYKDTSLATGFWIGKAVDKQISDSDSDLSNYWVRAFLQSDFRTTSEAGTRRLAVALRNVANNTHDLAVKQEIFAAVALSKSLRNVAISAKGYCTRFNLSEGAQSHLERELKTPAVFAEQFQFSAQEFGSHVAVQAVELDNGGTLMADSTKFNDIFRKDVVSEKTGKVRFVTEGKVIDQRFRKAKV